MPRTSRASQGGYVYHVIDRGNARSTVFRKPQDEAALVRLMVEANRRRPRRLTGHGLLPNPFHLVLWPYADGDLSRGRQWLLTAHGRRYQRHYRGSGHVGQGRFKAFPVEQDEHDLIVLRYGERNALRAEWVPRAADWPWCRLSQPAEARLAGLLSPGPVVPGRPGLEHVHGVETEAELQRLRQRVNRGTPFGSEGWTAATATALGLESSCRPRGRPRKK
jgi:putative transposase